MILPKFINNTYDLKLQYKNLMAKIEVNQSVFDIYNYKHPLGFEPTRKELNIIVNKAIRESNFDLLDSVRLECIRRNQSLFDKLIEMGNENRIYRTSVFIIIEQIHKYEELIDKCRY